MKLHLTHPSSQNRVTGYDEHAILINQVRYESSLIITPDQIIETPVPASLEQLTANHFEQLLALQPEIVLLGTGAALRFPHPRLYSALTNAQIGLEIMDSKAACRTYNILVAENRKVVAMILF